MASLSSSHRPSKQVRRTPRSWIAAALATAGLAVVALSGCALENGSTWTPGSMSDVPVVAAAAPVDSEGQVQALAAAQSPAEAAAPAEQENAEVAAAESEPLAFTGTVADLPAGGKWNGAWKVAGHTVHVPPSTNIDQRDGKLGLGTQVKVEGWQRPDGSISAGWIQVMADGPKGKQAAAGDEATATPEATTEPGTTPEATTTPETTPEITPEATVMPGATPGTMPVPPAGTERREPGNVMHPVEFRGTVDMGATEAISGTWQIGGHTVNVSEQTTFKEQLGKVEPGAYVQVIGWLQPDGTVHAAKILVKKNQPGKGQRAAVTPEAEASETPEAETPEVETPEVETPEVTGTATMSPDRGTPEMETPEADDEETGDVLPGDEEVPDDGNRNWDVRLHGQIEESTEGTGTWTVDGHPVVVDENTWLKAGGALPEGSWLQVKGLLQADGSILATSIQWVHRTPEFRKSTTGALTPVPTVVAAGQVRPGRTPVAPNMAPKTNNGQNQNHSQIGKPTSVGSQGNGQPKNGNQKKNQGSSQQPNTGGGNSQGNGRGHK